MGGWGCFHTLRKNYDSWITTEKALSILENCGYTIEDDCIKNAVKHMEVILELKTLPEGNEKSSDFETFIDLIVATRIRRFTLKCERANSIASQWAEVITSAFKSTSFSQSDYNASYLKTFGRKPKGGRLTDFVSFYQISLLVDELDEIIEKLMLAYVLEHENGIYYLYENKLSILPDENNIKQMKRYISAVDLLCRYKYGKELFAFATDCIQLKNH